jgi:hypothetical protein
LADRVLLIANQQNCGLGSVVTVSGHIPKTRFAMPPFSIPVTTIGLLLVSNIFMTFAFTNGLSLHLDSPHRNSTHLDSPRQQA